MNITIYIISHQFSTTNGQEKNVVGKYLEIHQAKRDRM